MPNEAHPKTGGAEHETSFVSEDPERHQRTLGHFSLDEDEASCEDESKDE
jgi:hypothetical protein